MTASMQDALRFLMAHSSDQLMFRRDEIWLRATYSGAIPGEANCIASGTTE